MNPACIFATIMNRHQLVITAMYCRPKPGLGIARYGQLPRVLSN